MDTPDSPAITVTSGTPACSGSTVRPRPGRAGSWPCLAFLLLFVPGLSGCLIPGYAPLLKKPERSASVRKVRLASGGLSRTMLVYAPKHRPDPAPLVIVLHGSLQTAGMVRVSTGYQFERLADQEGFVVAYPNGFGRHWNDCRKAARYAARTFDVDDKGFISDLIDYLRSEAGIDPSRVFAVGYSNGGHFVYRLALELPDRFAGVAAVAANLPTEANCDCTASALPIPVMIMNGTRDPVNPYNGGTVRIFGLGNRGAVRSSLESAEFFARMNGHTEQPTLTRTVPGNGKLSQQIMRLDWRDPTAPQVALVTVRGGGHAVPQSIYRAPILMGPTSHVINGPQVIWEFFASQLSAADHHQLARRLVTP